MGYYDFDEKVSIAAFFLTSAAEKLKLKEKTQPLGATLLKFVKTRFTLHCNL